MGNGAGVANRYATNSPQHDFDSLEQKCKSGFYKNHSETYLEDVTKAIRTDEIDYLEMLIAGGDISSINALHIAAKYSALESMELLISAGLSPFAVDKNGRTPLHICAAKKGESSALCVYALILAGEKSLKSRDFKAGNTPLHIAVTMNNVAVVDILVNAGASLSVTNTAGHSPRQIAVSMKFQEIIDIIDEKRTGKLRTRVASQQQKQNVEKPVDMERVMAVWERFFENALSGIDFTLQHSDEEEEELENEGRNEEALFPRDVDYLSGTYPSRANTSKGAYLSQKSSCVSRTEAKSAEEDYKSSQLHQACDAWFSHVLSYDTERSGSMDYIEDGGDVEGYGGDGYFVASCVMVGEATQDLDDHLYTQEQYDVWCGYDYASSLGEDWPVSVEQLIQMGWITFFDIDFNHCIWMYLPTGATENYLPVGVDAEMSNYVGLEPYDLSDPTWMAPPQVTARSWMMVRCARCDWDETDEPTSDIQSSGSKVIGRSNSTGNTDYKGSCRGQIDRAYKSSASCSSDDRKVTSNKDLSADADAKMGWVGIDGSGVVEVEGEVEGVEHEVWYYFNRVSGHSSWTEPSGWDGLLMDTGGWVLCAEEGHLEESYWWHSETNDIKWYSEDYE